jgi:hypothetical protein
VFIASGKTFFLGSVVARDAQKIGGYYRAWQVYFVYWSADKRVRRRVGGEHVFEWQEVQQRHSHGV